MQINIALDANNKQQAEQLRAVYYPNTTASQIRDAFLFDQCIANFCEAPEVLLPFMEKEEQKETVQRMLTIKSESNERLKTIAASLQKSMAATYRAIIAYSIENINGAGAGDAKKAESAGVSQMLAEKISLLETQLAACNSTMLEIKKLRKLM